MNWKFCRIFYLLLGSTLLSSCSSAKEPIKQQYPLSPDQIINIAGCGYATHIVDEQSVENPKTFWEPGEKKHCAALKQALAIELGQKVGIHTLQIYAGETASYKMTASLKGNAVLALNGKWVQGWNKIQLDKETDFLLFDLEGTIKIGEVIIEPTKPTVSKTRGEISTKYPLMQDFIGTNSFVDVPLGLTEPFGCVREYHDWAWTEPQMDTMQLDHNASGFDFKSFYVNFQLANKTIVPCIQKCPSWLNAKEQGMPTKEIGKLGDPTSYKRHSLFIKKYVSHFYQQNNGAVQYFENWNEPDKWWDGEQAYFSPFQYASMSSADRDGHKGKIGSEYGFKDNLKGVKLVMAGMANLKVDYLHALKYWCDKNRQGDFTWDVINYHQYSNASTMADDEPLKGVSPESAHIYEKTKELVNFRNNWLPNVGLWNTEFGYDTQKSAQSTAPIGEKSSELVQADWLIRSYLLLSAAGIDKAFQYMIRDAGKEGYYLTSGVYSSTLKEKPYRKAAWYYISTLRDVLYNSSFKGLSVDSVNEIYSIQYENKLDSLLKTTIIWRGSQSGKATKNYQLPTSVRKGSRLISFSAISPCGESRVLKGDTLTITETPLIIQTHPRNQFSPCRKLVVIPSSQVACTDQGGLADRVLLDEYAPDNDPSMGEASIFPKTNWVPGQSKGNEDSKSFDLGTMKDLHSIQVYDGSGIGEIELQCKSGGSWEKIGTIYLNQYNRWKGYVINKKTRYIKLVRMNGWADMGEVLFYESVID